MPAREEKDQLLDVVTLEASGNSSKVEFFREALRSEFAAVRARAARALSRCAVARDLQSFADLLESDGDPGVRREAAFALGETRDPSALPCLKIAARDAEPRVRGVAVQALGKMHGAALSWFEDSLRDPEPVVRREAVIATANLRDPDVPRLLVDRIAAERDERVRWVLYWALARQRDEGLETQRELVAAVGDPNFLVSAFSLLGLLSSEGTAGTGEILSVVERGKDFWLVKELAVRALSAHLERDGLQAAERTAIESCLAGETLPRRRDLLNLEVRAASPGVSDLSSAVAPLLSRGLRNPRARVRIGGRGEILLDLFVLDAPRHVAAFAWLARAGYFEGRKVWGIDPVVGVCFALDGGLPAGLPSAWIPPERTPGPCPRGALLSHGGSVGAFLVTYLPQPGLEGHETCWGKVALGMEVLDSLEEGDVIERVTIIDATGLPLPMTEATGS